MRAGQTRPRPYRYTCQARVNWAQNWAAEGYGPQLNRMRRIFKKRPNPFIDLLSQQSELTLRGMEGLIAYMNGHDAGVARQVRRKPYLSQSGRCWHRNSRTVCALMRAWARSD